MRVELIKIDQFSGDKAHFYSVILDDEEESLFEQFVAEFLPTHRKEIMDMLMRLRSMNEETGIREHYFKLNEGKPGDGVAAYYDLPGKNLRLYCIMYGKDAVVFGSGGKKPKPVRTYQELPLLHKQVQIMQKVSKLITEGLRSKDVKLNKDGSITSNTILDSYEND